MPKFKQLTKQQRISAFSRLQGAFKDGKLPHGEITKVAKIFGVTPSAISHLWRAGGGNTVDTLIRSPEFLKKTKRSGPVSKYDLNELREAIRKVPLRQRTCIRDLAAVLGIPKSTLHVLMKRLEREGMLPSIVLVSDEAVEFLHPADIDEDEADMEM